MVALEDASGSLLQGPDSHVPHEVPPRAASSYKPLSTFLLDKQRSYKQQYGDMYFLRLTKIKPAVDEAASAAWGGTVIGGEEATKVDRVLDVRQGELCWVSGTVYMDMPLKPNILDDVSKDRWISAPISTQKYYSEDDADQIMLEDESGRVQLVGELLKAFPMVTGCIIAVMGTENSSGEFEVIDIKFPDLPPQPGRWALTGPAASSSKKSKEGIALVSGLSFSGTDASHSLELSLLLEYLLGESLGPPAQADASRISRLIIAGDSISTADRKLDEGTADKKASKKYGYDASAYNALPSQLFDDFVSELLPSIPVTLMPGAQDPANASYPQQPIHMAMFPRARRYGPDPSKPAAPAGAPGWFDTVTNPFEAEVDGWRMLGTGGQNVDDVFKYTESDDRLGMMEAMCRWRCCAPTAPDTLWSYPFQEDEPFVLKTCPHVYFVGCQPEFSTRVIQGPEGQSVRLITVPSFAETKELVLLDTETLEVTKVKIDVA
ncbi:DNA polymerase alpha/epsilon subunit [Hirsutella rhossiliensis]|uniref:DNA-directed DNA polymerase n=1 Tax=Hirsutella rhossiliensis TaxID=111463 RepID=A0A9P8N1A1_9HYPO|nr:DNA polymerase alpha/epsilon subunit B domain-containing protein [Hirsutella rhossiliensis]KAH0965025.1 DNA polymerase alpha/epsilon subunit B domain-containing protein [Hirsutella rhossiliensis]